MLSHQLNHFAGLEPKLLANGIEGGPIFPCHLNDSIDLSIREVAHVSTYWFAGFVDFSSALRRSRQR